MGNDSGKTEVIYLQPAQRRSHAEDENEVSNAESWHACLWGLKKKEMESQTDRELSEFGNGEWKLGKFVKAQKTICTPKGRSRAKKEFNCSEVYVSTHTLLCLS